MERGEDATTSNSNWWQKAYYTPVSDALRGELSASLDARQTVFRAGLPTPITNLIVRILRGTRLWRAEKMDVARELVSHFSDGVAAGRSPEELVRDFGDADQAARLIRAAKWRNRPLWWQAWHFGMRTLLVLLGVAIVSYVALAARYHLGQPNIAHNYWKEINDARRVDETDRAWPVYREALIKLGQKDANTFDPSKLDDGPESQGWKDTKALVERHSEALNLVRLGAKRRRFGYYLGDKADVEAARAAGATWVTAKNLPLAEENRDLIGALLEGPQNSRALARMLVADARIAAAEGDGARAVSDLEALIGLAEQLFEPRATLVEQLIGLAIFGVATDAMDRILADMPAALSDEQWIALAHRLAAFRGGQVVIDMSAEQIMFDDVLQRAYTDNGHGDGRITPAGMKLFSEYSSNNEGILRLCVPSEKSDNIERVGASLIGPGVATLMGGREENRAYARETIDRMIAQHQGVPWQWDQNAIDTTERDFQAVIKKGRYRYYVVGLLLPALRAVYHAAERAIQNRDSTQTAIALVLWHRRRNEWPATLDLLVPDFLPEVPPDRVDGKPLRYIVRDGKPLLYSLGNNRRDDGGTANPEDPGRALVITYGPTPADWKPETRDAGDWILWPKLPEPREPADAPDGS